MSSKTLLLSDKTKQLTEYTTYATLKTRLYYILVGM